MKIINSTSNHRFSDKSLAFYICKTRQIMTPPDLSDLPLATQFEYHKLVKLIDAASPEDLRKLASDLLLLRMREKQMFQTILKQKLNPES